MVEELEQEICRMCQKLEDTLLIVTADHGHIDGRNVSITDYPAIMVGDYVAIATTDLTIYSSRELAQFFRGTHAGYTKDELEVPLIVFDAEIG